jgi:hypothetical protein
MIKSRELVEPDSCFNKADESELMFVILERDIAAPRTIRYWAKQRIKLGKNKKTDEQIIDALATADLIELSLERRSRA